MDYNEAIEQLTSQGKFYINLGLERISGVLDLLGNPQDKLKCIQVAGTNGKGSVCSMLYSILQKSGYKAGLYTSPHLFEYTERIGINGVHISKNDFGKYCEEVLKIADGNNIHLTEFEILTAMMYKYFADNEVEIAVIETGLGGRYDATNVLKTNLCSIITHIDLDHTDRLGDTKEKIAFEKAGIIKPGSFVITGEGYEVIKDRADELNSTFVLTTPFVSQEYIDALPLKGEQQVENLALVLAAVGTLFPDISEEVIVDGLKNVSNPCRFQYFPEKNLIVDGAHNPNCFEALRINLDKYYPNVSKQYVFGCLNTKDYKKMLAYITVDKNLKKLYIHKFNNPNSLDYETISSVVNLPCEKFVSLDEIIDKDVLTVVCGSLYMINEIIPQKMIYN